MHTAQKAKMAQIVQPYPIAARQRPAAIGSALAHRSEKHERAKLSIVRTVKQDVTPRR